MLASSKRKAQFLCLCCQKKSFFLKRGWLFLLLYKNTHFILKYLLPLTFSLTTLIIRLVQKFILNIENIYCAQNNYNNKAYSEKSRPYLHDFLSKMNGQSCK
jgi:hypothetical protein